MGIGHTALFCIVLNTSLCLRLFQSKVILKRLCQQQQKLTQILTIHKYRLRLLKFLGPRHIGLWHAHCKTPPHPASFILWQSFLGAKAFTRNLWESIKMS